MNLPKRLPAVRALFSAALGSFFYKRSLEKTCKKSLSVFFITALLLVFNGFSALSQLGVYQFTGTNTCPTQNPNVTTQPANAVFSSYTASTVSCVSATNLFQTNKWSTSTVIDLTRYHEFSFTVNNYYTANITSISFIQYTSAGTTSAWSLRSSLDNFATNIATGTATTTSQTPSVALPSVFSNITGVTFRLYLYGINHINTSWTNDNVTINGSINPVIPPVPPVPPTPTSNSPQCNPPGVAITVSGTPPADVVWYWQTSSTGTSVTNSNSTFNTTTTGTYFLRARNSVNLIWSDPASISIIVTPNVTTPIFVAGSASTRCQGAGVVTYTATASNSTGITYSLDATASSAGNSINAGTGEVTYASGWSGTAIITAVAAGCNPKTATHTVTVTPSVGTPVFASGASSIRCQGAGMVLYAATAANATGITYSLDGTSSGAGNTINSSTGEVSFLAGWSGTSVITASAAGCSGPRTSTHTVTITSTVGNPVFISGATSTRCQGSGTITYTANATTNTGITYSLDASSTTAGNTINTLTGAVTYVANWAGNSTITATATGCNGPRSSTHVVTTTATVGLPVFTSGASSTRCQGAANINYIASATNSTSIVYSLDATSITAGNAINSATGAVTFVSSWSGTTTITATANGCNGPRTANHTVTTIATVATPIFNLGSSSRRCQGAGTVTYTATSTNSTGVTYSLDAASIQAGNSISSTNGTVTFVSGWTGVSTITASATGCNGPAIGVHTVTTFGPLGPLAFTNGSTSTRCQATGTLTYTATATNTFGIVYSLDASSLAAGNTINASTGAVTYSGNWYGTTVITAFADGCGGPYTATHTVTVTQGVGTPVFSMGTTSTRCQSAATINYPATASNSSNISYSLDAASEAGGVTISVFSGTVTYPGSWSGTTVITATATGCGSPSSTHTVTITPVVGTPIFNIGATSSRCQGSSSISYTATAANSTIISYSLDPTSLGAGNSINSSTGVVNYVSGFSGTSIITATAQGCFGPSTSTHTVTTTATVGTPVFVLGTSSTRCQVQGTESFRANATDATSITYSLDAASLAAGNTINSNTGAVTFITGWNSNSVITATSSGCNGSKTANHTVTTRAAVATPVFSLGTTSNRCQGASTVTYSATASNSFSITYDLDADALAAGNTINSNTGAVTYVAGWTGTTIITANAEGCYGPTEATHTVTITPGAGTPTFTLGTVSARCQAAGSVTYTATATNSTGITYSLDATSRNAGNSINSSTGVVTYVSSWVGNSIITATAVGCSGNLSSTHSVTTSVDGKAVFALGASSTRCQGAATESYSASASTGASITYSLDNTSLNAGNTINSATGTVTFAAGWSGTSTVSATTLGCIGQVTSTHTVNTTPTVGIPVFTLGLTSVRCQSFSTITYSATATNTTGITYSLDAASLAAGNTINTGTGAVTFVAAWNGTSKITATAKGCNGPSTNTHTVTTSSSGTPVFSIGVASSRCQGTGGVANYTATTTNTSGITYSIDAASITAGNSINSSTGAVTFAATFTGNLVITASSSGCNGTVTAKHTVSVTANVTTPVFTLGATSERCFSEASVFYKATATNAASVTYSLDANTLAAGNTIDAATGEVAYTSTWFGTSVITITAEGCNGPKIATHTVTTLSTCAYNLEPLNVTEVIPAGAKIINLGITPQTAANGLKPYGLLYQLLNNAVPVKWAINDKKVKDGIDFIHNNVRYRGSAFIILPKYLTPAINAIISQWQAKGVVVNTSVSNFSVNIYTTITSTPRWILDASQTIIARKFFSDAEIPTSAWIGKQPSELGSCDDMFILPHADASWPVHKNLFYWNKDYKGSLWVGCYAITGLENLSGPDINNPATTVRMNFLMSNPTSGTSVAVPFNQHRNPSPPFKANNAAHPIMQYVGHSDGAHTNGPEQVFLPAKGGGYRPSTTIFVDDPSHKDVPSVSNGPASIIAFGKAFGDANRGYVMYEAGHHINNASAPEEVAATRAFFNYSFFNVREKQLFVTSGGISATIISGQTFNLTATATSQNINPEFTFLWSTSCGGSFANPTSANTTFIAPSVTVKTLCNITIKVFDQCGRMAFDTRSFEILPAPRGPVCNSDAIALPSCDGNKPFVNVLANDENPDGFPLTVTLIGQGAKGTFKYLGAGKVQYEPGAGFYSGSDQVQYQVCDSRGMCCTSTILVSVSQLDANGCGPDQFIGVVGTISALRATFVSGSVVNKDFGLGDPDGIPGDNTTYSTSAFSGSSPGVVTYSLENTIPAAGPLNLYVSSNSDGKFFKVEESTDSLNWKNPVTFPVGTTDNFSEQTAKIYNVNAGTRFIRVSNINGNLLLDAMEYSVRGCISAVPIASEDITSTYEDVPVEIEVDANDLDPQGLQLTVSDIIAQPTRGRLSINTNNTITYLNFKDQVGNGLDSFSYRICNTSGLCATAKVYINITADNCGPGLYKPIPFNSTMLTVNATNDTYISNKNTTTNYGSATSLVAKGKFNDKKRMLLEFNLSAVPSNAIIDSASLMIYRSNAFNNENISVYRSLRSWTSTGATWNRATAAINWSSTGGDFNPNAIATANTGFSNGRYITWKIRSLVQSWTNNTMPNQGIILGRNPDNNGTHDIIFNASEASANKPLLVLAYRVPGPCTAIPLRAPLAMPDTAVTDAVTPISIPVITNDYDYNQTGLNVSLSTTTSQRGGTLSLFGNNVIYTPTTVTPAFNGIDTFRYVVCSSGLCDSANVFIKVTNAPPAANGDSATLASNTTLTPSNVTVNVLLNDRDPEGSAVGNAVIVKQAKNGEAVVSGNNILYTPEFNFVGRDTIIYQISELTSTDCSRLSDTAFVIFIVTNRPPIATGESVTVNPCESTVINVTNNDVDPERGNLTLTLVSQPSIGTAILDNNNSQIKYYPLAGVSNTTTTLQYRVCDTEMPPLCSDVVTLTITIRPIPDNKPPVANRDTFRMPRDQILYADVLTNDFEPDNQEFSVPLGIVTNPVNGAVLPLGNGLIRYTPSSRFAGVDSFQYRVADSIDAVANCSPKGTSLSATAWAYIIVQEEPIADPDYINVVAGTTTSLKVLLNDVFGYNKAALGTITIIVPPKVGSFAVDPGVLADQSDDDIIYTPNVGYIGKDSLIYRICDRNGNCDTAIVRLKMWSDTDLDGIPDYLDIDDDNDGIPDVLEVCGKGATSFSCIDKGTDPAGDDDDDDIPNWKDEDYGTLNNKGAVAILDSDGDGIPDFLDLDSDNDGVPDVVEAYGVDVNGDGIIDNFTDTDKDGLSQNVDANNTGAEGSGNGLGFIDFDGDGIPNTLDLDSDNDGIPDIVEAGGIDNNNDGRVDSFVDVDLNGLNDPLQTANALIRTGVDANNDGRADNYPNKNIDQQGRPNLYDIDSDGDGITDAIEAGFPASVTIVNGLITGARTNGWANSVRAVTTASLALLNTDGRALPNYLDIDSDDDGISDNIEGQSTRLYKLPSGVDADNDGLDDVYETLLGISGGEGITPHDQDNDGIPDYRDTDSDNDGLSDLVEASRILTLTQTNINTADADGDGLVDQFDVLNVKTIGSGQEYLNVVSNKMGVNGTFTGPTPTGSNVLLVQTLASYTDRDWRILNTLTLGNHVWYDFNKNGLKDANETVIAGATVKLYHDAEGDKIPDGAALLTATTDPTGSYQFSLLSATKYIVGVTLPTGYAMGYSITSSSDPNNGIDNDNNGVVLVGAEVRSNHINLTASSTTLDFGLKGTGVIGDFVFFDVNANGVQNVGETGIAGVTISITNSTGITSNTTTNANGLYSFTELAPGNYTITFATPSGYIASPALQGADVAKDSDPVNGSVNVNLVANQTNNNIDAAFYQLVRLGNHVWFDANLNGIKNSGEPAIVAATVKLYLDANNDNIADGFAIATTTTDANGLYAFNNLVPNNYIVGVTLPTGYSMLPINGGDPDNDIDNDNNGVNLVGSEVRTFAITLTSQGEPINDGDDNNGNQTLDIGLRAIGTISNFVWNDVNGNGIQDDGEVGMAGVVVSISGAGVSEITTTDASGNYSFTNLLAGTYTITFNKPNGYFESPAKRGTDVTKDSDPVNGLVSVTLTAGQQRTDIDAGYYIPYSIGNHVWYDFNLNGIKDAGETGIAGATVKLYKDSITLNVPDGPAIATTITDANGAYQFTNVASGKYLVAVVLPNGYTKGTTTASSSNPNNGIDNDNNGVTLSGNEVRTNNIDMNGSTSTIDIGLNGTGVIRDFVWNDFNANGIQDAEETGLANVQVTITDVNGLTRSVTTNTSGIYALTALAPGSYTVTFTTSLGYYASPSGRGTNPALDSDPVNGSVSVTLAPGEDRSDIDAGFYEGFAIGNKVWYDLNHNGLLDGTEYGIAGLTVNLYTDSLGRNTPDGAAIATTTTDASGNYVFNKKGLGKYIVSVVTPAGYIMSATTATSSNPNNGVDNDNNGVITNGGEVLTNTLNLIASTNTIDIGLVGTGSIGDFVFNDHTNNDGIHDAEETGIGNVIVTLTTPGGATSTTTTNTLGQYTFNDLLPGTYTIAFTTPSGYIASPSKQGADTSKDSDPVAGSVSVSLTAGEQKTDIDAGYFVPSSVGNLVWYDYNQNGLKDDNEAPISGATVKLYKDVDGDNQPDGTAIATTTTGANGLYQFLNLPKGNYIVGVTVTGYTVGTTIATSTDPNNHIDNDNNGVVLVGSEVRSNFIAISGIDNSLDFGLKGNASIGDYVWFDSNGNGIQEAAETGIADVTVTLTNANGFLRTTTSDATGFYTFNALTAGTYTLSFATPTGHFASPANMGSDATKNSDPVNGTVTVALATGENKTDIDAGFYLPYTLGNNVWYDFNQNGLLDAGETPIAGATVRLYKDANTDNIADGASIATSMTDSTGNYYFGNLAVGKYIVGVQLPSGYVQGITIASSASPDNGVDNDNNGIKTVSGEIRSNYITVDANLNTLDFGLIGTSAIGNFVWNDLNTNGLQDGGLEVGIANAVVSLTNVNGVIRTTTTSSAGEYSFVGLEAGTYTVTFTTPSGFFSSISKAGNDDTKDSDPQDGSVVVTLGIGQINNNIDAGFYSPLTLGNQVFYDMNNNGILDGESGVAGVVVKLYKDVNGDNLPDGPSIATTTTAAGGIYQFNNLEAGKYIVGITIPAGYVPGITTSTSANPNNNIDNDNNGVRFNGTELFSNYVFINSSYDFLDFGLKGTGAIGNYTWVDANGNGVQDAGEIPLAGVQVSIKGGGGVTLTTTTDANGLYNFNDIAPGSYTITFKTPTGYVLTPAKQGTDPSKDSDPTGTNNATVTITLGAGEINNDIDAGYFLPYIIGDRVFFDINNNGIFDANEKGLPGITVHLYRTNNLSNAVVTTTTDANGYYAFTDLRSNNYVVGVIMPSGYTAGATTSTSADPVNGVDNDNNGVTVIGSELRTNAFSLVANSYSMDFGLKGTGSIGDFVWSDTNADGKQDAGEPGLEGVTISITHSSMGQVATTTSNASGIYSFDNLIPGSYTLNFTTPNGYIPSPNLTAGNLRATNSDPVNGAVSVSLTAGQTTTEIDAGFYPSFNLGNTVWYDFNNNGIKDAGEPGISGATVRLYLDANGDNIVDNTNPIATFTTTSTGTYNFGGLKVTSYIVGVVLPTGYTIGTTIASSSNPNNGIDDDNNGVNLISTTEVRSNRISLTGHNSTLDFGLKGTSSIGDFVWNDANGNGIQDVGEAGIPGATVSITNSSGLTYNTTTNSSGIYSFTGLIAGTYTVAFPTPAGYIPTPAGKGTDVTKNSDPVNGSVAVTVTTGQARTDIDSGFQPSLSLGNTVWYDFNNNGLKDANEKGISGAIVKLYADADGNNIVDGTAMTSTITDANGNYIFENLLNEKYIVGVVLPNGYTKGATTSTSNNPNNNTDNDNNGVTLVSGEVRTNYVALVANNNTIDIGLAGTASIGDLVWNDANGNGIQDPAEAGISGVTVTVTNESGMALTTTTNSSGIYAFNTLAAGTYNVAFTTPSGYRASPSAKGTDATKDSDPVNGNVTVTLTANQVKTDIDAGFYQPYTIGNHVWYDFNRNGTKDAGEAGVSGVTVKLYADENGDNIADGAAINTTTTNATGIYSFSSLAAGKYIVAIVTPSGYAKGATTATSNNPNNEIDNDNNGVNINGLEISTNFIVVSASTNAVDIGLEGTGSIGDYVWKDVNGNGLQDVGEEGFEDVMVSITNSTGVTYTTSTDDNGRYSFSAVAPGSYVIEFATPAGYEPSAAGKGTDKTKDSDPVNGSVNVSLAANQVRTDIDAGFYQTFSIGNLVWYDVNNNGFKDANEKGIAGATVKLYVDANGDNIADGPAICSTTTDAGGIYIFGNLDAANYIVGVVLPSGYTIGATTSTSADPNNNVDDDNNGVMLMNGEVCSNYISVSANVSTLDIAMTGTASIGNFVWEDANANGIQDAGETGIEEVVVSIASPNGISASTTTDANGNYTFGSLVPGSYTVSFSTPSGYIATLSNQGTDRTMDSDPANGKVVVDLLAGQQRTDIDAGFYKPFSIGNTVWYDLNNNGLLDTNEAGVEGVLVKLYTDNNGDNLPDGVAVATTTTDAAGTYGFEGLFAGKYLVGVQLPIGYTRGATTTTSASPGNNIDGDNNGVRLLAGEVFTNSISLIGANNTIDIGLTGSGSIGDKVWLDENGNNIRDTNESGIAGATVTIKHQSGFTVTTTTDVNGNYNFKRLIAGIYTLHFSTPSVQGAPVTIPMIPRKADVGDDNFDSDPDPATGDITVILGAGEINNSVDAGFAYDQDDDDDGIPNSVESHGFDPYADDDNDGVPNYLDPTPGNGVAWKDVNNDGINDFFDFDLDGILNELDLDSDNDGIPDILESGDLRAADSNRDGKADGVDNDGDGILSTADPDDNVYGNQGLQPKDFDRDGKFNFMDLDSDGDGIVDAVEAGFSGVSVSNGIATGAKTNGWANSARVLFGNGFTLRNTDGRGLPDYLDIDSDDDGIQDNVEGQPTTSFKVASDTDTDGDGLVDAYDINPNTYGGHGITPYDHDFDGIPDYRDSDTDNDGAPDINEASKDFNLSQSNINTDDADEDGLLDEFDIVDLRTLTPGMLYTNISNSNMGTNGSFDGPSPSGSLVKLIRSATVGDRDWRSTTTLPLQVVNFTGVLSNRVATLTWKVQNENEVEYYSLERSANGRDFEQVAKIKAKGSASESYTYKDNLENYTSNYAYYRVRQVNKAANEYVTNVVLLKLEQKKEINAVNIFPNPFVDVVNIYFNSLVKDELDVRILDVRGRVIINNKYKVVVGSNTIVIPELARLAQGIYLVVMNMKGETINERLIKQ